MKWYIREVVIPEYAKNFNKGLSAEDIKFYGKIHFDRNRSNNELNMHCHLIVSRKDQSNKKKLSPLTNHKNTKKGAIKGGFDRKNLFQQTEKGFDQLFNYNRPLSESFEYYNTMKNGSIADQLNMQERKISDKGKRIDSDRQVGIYADKQESLSDNKQSFSLPDTGLSSVLGLFTPDVGNTEDEQIPKKKKIKKKPKRGFRR